MFQTAKSKLSNILLSSPRQSPKLRASPIFGTIDIRSPEIDITEKGSM